MSMNFKEFITSFKEGSSSWEEDPIFKERIQVAQILLDGRAYPQRTLKAPEYLTDFGLRKDGSAELLILYWKDTYHFHLPDLGEMEKEFASIHINELPYYIDASILVLGNYSFVYEQLLKRYPEVIEHIHDKVSLLKLATLCGALGDVERSNELFQKAKSQDGDNNKVVSHRIAALQLKRNHSIEEFYKEINDVLEDIVTIHSNENAGMIALLNNLIGLELVMRSSDLEANTVLSKLLLENAQIIIYGLLDSQEIKNESELVRYSSQIAINQVQLELKSQNYENAEKIIEADIALVKMYNREYIAEAYATYAYVLYCKKDFQKSIQYSIKAIKEQGLVGNVLGVQQGQKLLISNLVKTGQEAQAKEVYGMMQTDILGRGSYEQDRIKG